MSAVDVPTTADAAGVVDANGIRIAYETFGDRSAPPLVLVMGLGGQMLDWPDDFCRLLVAAGHHVVRFDNRDAGLSTHFDAVAPPSVVDLALRRRPAYKITDMADDCAGLLDGLGLQSVHLVGVSLGGFIAQTVALRYPDRVRTLTLIMTSTGSRRVGRPDPRALVQIARLARDDDRETVVASAVAAAKIVGSPGYPRNDEDVAAVAARGFDRAHDPAGRMRQLGAIVNQPDRTPGLASLGVPTLVVHGFADRVVNADGGRALARAIPGARFVGYPGMGHDLPRALWPEMVGEITALTARG